MQFRILMVMVMILLAGQSLSAADIATSEEPVADAVLSLWEHRLARALASVINLIDPDVIVLGGGLSNIGRIYTNLPKLWTEFVTSDHIVTRLVAAKYGDASGVRGAAWLGRQMGTQQG